MHPSQMHCRSIGTGAGCQGTHDESFEVWIDRLLLMGVCLNFIKVCGMEIFIFFCLVESFQKGIHPPLYKGIQLRVVKD